MSLLNFAVRLLKNKRNEILNYYMAEDIFLSRIIELLKEDYSHIHPSHSSQI